MDFHWYFFFFFCLIQHRKALILHWMWKKLIKRIHWIQYNMKNFVGMKSDKERLHKREQKRQMNIEYQKRWKGKQRFNVCIRSSRTDCTDHIFFALQCNIRTAALSHEQAKFYVFDFTWCRFRSIFCSIPLHFMSQYFGFSVMAKIQQWLKLYNLRITKLTFLQESK